MKRTTAERQDRAAKEAERIEAERAAEQAKRRRIEQACPEAKHISMFWHCRRCLAEWKAANGTFDGKALSPQDYQRISVGWTMSGLQVWCNRHEINVMHIDFEGVKHPATTNALKEGTMQ